MCRYLKLLTSNTVRKTISIIAIYIFCISGYYVFLSNRYDLFWSYIFLPLGLVLHFAVKPKKVVEEKENVPLKKKVLKPGAILILLNILLFTYNYFMWQSPITVEKGEFEFAEENPEYTLHHLDTTSRFSKRFEDVGTTLKRHSNLPTEYFSPEFGEALLKDLSNIEGKSLGFIKEANFIKARLREGKPVDIGLTASSKHGDVLRIEVYPNDIANAIIAVPGEGMRLFRLELSEDSLVYFREMFE